MVLFAQHARGLILVERNRALELGRPDRRGDLGRVDSRVTKKGSDLLEVVVLLEHLHRHAVPDRRWRAVACRAVGLLESGVSQEDCDYTLFDLACLLVDLLHRHRQASVFFIHLLAPMNDHKPASK